MMVWVKTEEKRLRKCIDFMTPGSFVSIDHFNFYSRSEILCRYTSSFGNWVIFNSSVFNDTFQYFISILSLLGHMINFLIDMFYEIVHFCIPKFKIESVKSKLYWKESATDANAVSHGHPTDGLLLNTLITLFRQSRVLLDV